MKKRRLFLRQWGRFEVGVSLDPRDVWVGLYWRNEVYREFVGWLELREFYVCPVPCVVFSLRWSPGAQP